MRVAIDVGGTFTDAVAFDEDTGSIVLAKAPTRHSDLVGGIEEALAHPEVALPDVTQLVHGSTLAINAILERRGARTALVTTKGFRDVYEIGRINRPESFNLFFRKHRPLVPRELLFEVPERVLPDGTEELPLDEGAVRAVAVELRRRRVEAVAVVFLHSYRWPRHEQEAVRALCEEVPGCYVIASHQLSREYREYERTSTTAASAYIGPLISGYLGQLEGRLASRGLRGEILVMQSSGGMSELKAARTQCLQLLESGPVAGVVGAGFVGDELGLDDVIAFDMGGTTAKACVVRRGTPSLAADYFIGGYNEGLAIRIPILDIVEIGTGGGSIGWIEEGGSLHVGPVSAGAEPGPAAYGRGGTAPTITDASVLLGEIGTQAIPGSQVALDLPAAERAIRTGVAEPLGLAPRRVALGLLQIATASMANAVRSVTTQRGLDPRDFTLVAYGGAGPLRAAGIATDLGIPRVVVPRAPANFGALGMLLADRRQDYVQTLFTRLESVEMGDLEEAYQKLEQEALGDLGAGGAAGVQFQRAADMRYGGQEHAVLVPVPACVAGEDARTTIKERFDATHLERFSHHAPGEPAEVVSLRLEAVLPSGKPLFPELAIGGPAPPDAARLEPRDVTFDAGEGAVACARYRREGLLAGNVVRGPALVEEASTVTVVPPEVRLTVHGRGHLVLELRS